MKITKAKLKQIIQEELSTLKEVEYAVPSKEGDRTPDDVEVLVQGYGGLRIGQIRNGLTKRIAEAHIFDWQTEPLRGLDHLLAGGVVEVFYKTLKAHNALMPAEEGEE
jgi:hypothetical protein